MKDLSQADRVRILRVFSDLTSKEYGRLRFACAIQTLDAHALEELIADVVRERWKLALSLAKFAQGLSLDEEVNLRNVISRNYYACYHAARALVFWVTRADVDDHSRLPVKFRNCMETRDKEKGDLLDKWRHLRNEVEYSPFPEIENLAETARESIAEAGEFLELCKGYLRKGGVSLDEDKE